MNYLFNILFKIRPLPLVQPTDMIMYGISEYETPTDVLSIYDDE